MEPVILWWLAIGLSVVVTLVVAALLTIILRTARDIEDGAAAIWANGQRVANNTIHIPVLYSINETAGAILKRASGILTTAKDIVVHAQDCPGCPRCILGTAR